MRIEGAWHWQVPAGHYPVSDEPHHIHVLGTPDEFETLGWLPHYNGGWVLPSETKALERQSDGTLKPIGRPDSVNCRMPPKREHVHYIARKIEVDVPDQHLIDWMRREP